ncbi:MAG: hypothetical protein EOP02_27565, partial [Proteobacteria bacterium]
MAQLASRLVDGSLRLERLRDFGKPLGGLLTCACSRLDLETGGNAILIVAMELVGRAPSYEARLQWLVDGLDQAASAFDGNGRIVASNTEARDIAGTVRTLADLEATTPSAGRIDYDLYAIGRDKEHATIALMSLQAVATPVLPEPPQPAPPPIIAAPKDQLAIAAPPVDEGKQAPIPSPIASAAPADEALSHHVVAPQSDADLWTTNRRHPLRFIWQMNADGRFSLGG